MGPSDTGTIPHPVTEELRATIAAAGITESTDLVARILATGLGSYGIRAQSFGLAGAGNVAITVHDGMIIGGSGDSVGVDIADGASNTLTNHGVIATVNGIAGMAVRGTTGNETVTTTHTLIGSIDLGVGMNTDSVLIDKLLSAGGSSGGTGSVGINPDSASGRVSWREVLRK